MLKQTATMTRLHVTLLDCCSSCNVCISTLGPVYPISSLDVLEHTFIATSRRFPQNFKRLIAGRFFNLDLMSIKKIKAKEKRTISLV
ncbi:hypothetical protein BpHYR1_010819 [Brachionus plicatilis]|uniref:Uncharacterized protein n=1 Tax=Brachionus plicatilis TaxID=10195 RepID=A0A3M7QGA7_BRAPC|nr:hypothetical protein BpHYR1_010819 [Brachionus plicatilis]